MARLQSKMRPAIIDQIEFRIATTFDQLNLAVGIIPRQIAGFKNARPTDWVKAKSLPQSPVSKSS